MFKSLLDEHPFLKVIITIIKESQSTLGVTQWRCGLELQRSREYIHPAQCVVQPWWAESEVEKYW